MRRAAAVSLLLFACAAPALAEEPRPPGAILLVASPELADPNFSETVVLVTRWRAFPGPLGVVINRPTSVPLSRVLADMPALSGIEDKVFQGGPVARQVLFYVFRAEKAPEDAIEVAPGIYLDWGGERLKQLLGREKPTEGLRIYAGHAAWAPGQLEAEVARGSWKSARPEARTIFSDKPESLWAELERRSRATPIRFEAARP